MHGPMNVKNVKIWITLLLWKVCIRLLYVAKLYQNVRCKKKNI